MQGLHEITYLKNTSPLPEIEWWPLKVGHLIIIRYNFTFFFAKSHKLERERDLEIWFDMDFETLVNNMVIILLLSTESFCYAMHVKTKLTASISPLSSGTDFRRQIRPIGQSEHTQIFYHYS